MPALIDWAWFYVCTNTT